MFLVYPPHVLHQLCKFGVVLRELRAPRLGQGGVRPSAAVLDGPLQSPTAPVVLCISDLACGEMVFQIQGFEGCYDMCPFEMCRVPCPDPWSREKDIVIAILRDRSQRSHLFGFLFVAGAGVLEGC